MGIDVVGGEASYDWLQELGLIPKIASQIIVRVVLLLYAFQYLLPVCFTFSVERSFYFLQQFQMQLVIGVQLLCVQASGSIVHATRVPNKLIRRNLNWIQFIWGSNHRLRTFGLCDLIGCIVHLS